MKSRGLTRENHDSAQAALTYAIMDSAAEGERNPRKLAIAGVAPMDRFQPTIQMLRACSLSERPADYVISHH